MTERSLNRIYENNTTDTMLVTQVVSDKWVLRPVLFHVLSTFVVYSYSCSLHVATTTKLERIAKVIDQTKQKKTRKALIR